MKILRKYPFVNQHDERDCGAACLSMIAEYYGCCLKLETCRRLTNVDSRGTSIYGIIRGAEIIGLSASSFQANKEELLDEVKNNNIKFPIIVRTLFQEKYEHFCVVYNIDKNSVFIGNPADSKIRIIPTSVFNKIWLGQLITFTKTEKLIEGNERTNSFNIFIWDLKKNYPFIIGGFVASVFILLVNLAGAYLFRFILSDSYNSFYLFGSIVIDGIEKICVALILLYFFRMIIDLMRCKVLSQLSQKLDMLITMKYYKHLIKMKLEAFEKRRAGDYLSRFFDIGKIRDMLSTVVLSVLLDTGMATFSGIILFKMNRKMFIISVIIITVYVAIVLMFKNIIRKNNNDVMAGNAIVSSALKESIDGIQTIKALRIEERNISKLSILYRELLDKKICSAIVTGGQNALSSFVASIGIVVVMCIGYKEYIHGTLSIADLFTFYYVLDYFMGPISGIINLQPDIESAIIAADRIGDIFDIDEEDGQHMCEMLNGDISFRNVTFRYGYNEPVIKNFSVDIKEGSKVAIIGESGSGKTTFAKLLMGFYFPEDGIICIGNKDINIHNIGSVRNSIAYVSQETFLFEGSIYDNLVVGNPEINIDRVKDIINKCGLCDFINQEPYGLDTLISEGGNNLSGGQRQRIAIARALVSEKKIVVLDEVTSNQDERFEKNINKIVSELPEDITCIVITHHKEMMNCCERVIELQIEGEYNNEK